MHAVNPFVDQRALKLENYLDEYVEQVCFRLEDVKSTISNRYVQTRHDTSYRFSLGDRFTFYGRLYWVTEEGAAIPYLHIEVALANLPSNWQREGDFYEFLMELNSHFHDPLKIGILENHVIGLVLRGRVDKVAPDYYEGLIEDLVECATELFEKLQNRYGTRIRSMADYLEKLFPEFPSKVVK